MSLDIPENFDEAVSWVDECLLGGQPLSQELQKSLDRFDTAVILAPKQEGGKISVDGFSRKILTKDADAIAASILKQLKTRYFRTLIVEDDLSRFGDPYLKDARDISFFGDRVIRWMGAEEDALKMVELTRFASSGYPTVAIVSSLSIEELGLYTGVSLDLGKEKVIASSGVGIIVSIYDAEAFLLLTTKSIGDAIQCE